MKAISLWQPFASLIVLGFKTFETRSWDTKNPLYQTTGDFYNVFHIMIVEG